MKTTLYLFASKWCSEQMKPFTSEDMKKAYFAAGHSAPGHLNHFGLVMMRLSCEGVIRQKSICTAKMPLAHGRLIRIWISVPYAEKQRLNAMNNGYTQTALPI